MQRWCALSVGAIKTSCLENRMDGSRFQLYHRPARDTMTQPSFTPGAERALQMAGRLARRSNSSFVEPVHLLRALALDESRAAEIIAAHGLTSDDLRRIFPLEGELTIDDRAPEEPPVEPGESLRTVLIEARRQASFLGKYAEVGSEHLLCGLAAVPSAVQELLEAHGLALGSLAECSLEQAGETAGPLPGEVHLSLPHAAQQDATDAFRILDAAANRAREGVRVVEDYVRFTLDDRHLTGMLKNWRHRLAEALAVPPIFQHPREVPIVQSESN